MLNTSDILETIHMISEENLDVRTVTMGISLLDCVSDDQSRLETKIYDNGCGYRNERNKRRIGGGS